MKDIEDEILFTVPEGWEVVHLKDIGIFRGGQTPKTSELYDSGNVPYFKVSDMNTCGNELFMNSAVNYLMDNIKYRLFPQKSIIFPKNGGAIFTNKKRILTKKSLIDLNSGAFIPSQEVNSIFIYYLFLTIDFNKFYKGSAVPTIDFDLINELLWGLPPLAEQKRIVAKIERIFTQIDLLEQNKADLQTTVKQAKSKILDLAIRGKLVPQDPDEEPASVMLEKLRAEKEAKIAAGEIKRGKTDSYIYKNSTDNCYYEKFDDGTEKSVEILSAIPESWTWCHFGDISDVINGKNQSQVEDDTGEYPIYGSGGIMGYANDYICPENCTIIGRKGSINNPIFMEEKFWNVDTAFGLAPSSIILPRYLFYFCKSFDFTSLDSSTTLPSLTKANIQHILFPLPPFAAQQRILDKIDELFSQLDKIFLNIV